MKTALDSAIIRKYLSQEKIDAYAEDLEVWFEKHDLWHLLGPADHFAIKIPDEKTLRLLTQAIKPYCVEKKGNTPGLSMRKMDGRIITTAILAEPLHIRLNQIDCIEIMQSKPENVGKDVVGLDHLEFINGDFEKIKNILTVKEIDYGINIKNGYKKTIIVKINALGEEVKFTDKTLASVVPLQIKDNPGIVEIVLPMTE
jgi:predicted metalloenzyme YecM